MRRIARLAFAVTLGCAAAALAGDPPKTKKATKGVTTLPSRWVRPVKYIRDLAPAQSSLVAAYWVAIAQGGVGWIDPDAEQLAKEKALGYALPTLVRRADGTLDLDVTGCDVVWPSSLVDGTPFVPTKSHVRVAHFIDGGTPTSTVPESCHGEWLWSLPPATVAFVAPDRIGVDDRGEAWIDYRNVVRLAPFSGSAGPAVMLTTLDRDAVKLDLSGVRFRWIWDFRPKSEDVDPARTNGHKSTPFAVTSFTVDGRVATRMPQQFLAPKLKDLKAGDSGFVESYFVDPHPDGSTWVDSDAVVESTASLDSWGYAKVAVRRIDETTVSLDLAGTTHRWGVPYRRQWAEKHIEQGVKQSSLKVAAVTDGAQDCGAAMPDRCLGDMLGDVEAGATVYASCRYIAVDRSRAGFVPTWIPVSNTPFADELGAAAAIRVEDDEGCTVDVTDVTYVWELQRTPEITITQESPRRRLSHLKVVEFDVPDDPEPPKPPPKKPPTKKK